MVMLSTGDYICPTPFPSLGKAMAPSALPPLQPSETTADELRVLGLITFVSMLVGATIAVFDSGLWLKSGDVETNAYTYAMAAFTLQGMSFVLYKLLMQDSMDHKAGFARMDKERQRRMQRLQQDMANRQMELEMRMQEAQFQRQMLMMEQQTELQGLELDITNFADMLTVPRPPAPPNHPPEEKGSIDLGPSQPRDKGGRFATKK